jgi:micrococcal nuclease
MEWLIGKLLIILLSLFGFGGLPENVSAPAEVPDSVGIELETAEMAQVLRVIDGDTIEVLLADGSRERVRYLGIDTPEENPDGIPECYATEATQLNNDLVTGVLVQLEAETLDRDEYGRLLRYVYAGSVDVSAELLKLGAAQVMMIPPNTRRNSEFRNLYQIAQGSGMGMHSVCQ